VGVWVGNFDRRPLTGSSGVAGAGPIFHAVMVAAQSRAVGDVASFGERPTLADPERTAKETICALSGMRASPWCPPHRDEWIAADAIGAGRECTWHVPRSGTPNAERRPLDPRPLDPRTLEPRTLEPRTPNPEPRRTSVTVLWPPEYVAWARTERLLDQTIPLPPTARVARVAAREPVRPEVPDRLRIVSPPDGAAYLTDPTLRRDYQTVSWRAAATDTADVEWRIDGQLIGHGAGGAALAWPLTPGAHTVSIRDVGGREAAAAFVVK